MAIGIFMENYIVKRKPIARGHTIDVHTVYESSIQYMHFIVCSFGGEIHQDMMNTETQGGSLRLNIWIALFMCPAL